MSEAAPRKGETARAIVSGTTGVAAGLLSLVGAACCVSPVVAPIIVGVLGASGAVWAASLKPYGSWILGVSLLFLAFGFWTVYRPRPACAVTDAPTQNRFLPPFAKGSLWVGAICWIVGLVLRLLLP